jgi:hypothetical protein
MAWDPTTGTWTNSGYWQQTTAAAQLTMARAFVTELMNAITARARGNGEELDPSTLNELLKEVKADIPKIQRQADVDAGVGLPRMVSTRTRDLKGGC